LGCVMVRSTASASSSSSASLRADRAARDSWAPRMVEGTAGMEAEETRAVSAAGELVRERRPPV
jgi:hypothetical protein